MKLRRVAILILLPVVVFGSIAADGSNWTWVIRDPKGSSVLEIALAGSDAPTVSPRPEAQGGPLVKAKIRTVNMKTGAQISQNRVSMDFVNCDPRKETRSFMMFDVKGEDPKRVTFTVGDGSGSAGLGNALCEIGMRMLTKR